MTRQQARSGAVAGAARGLAALVAGLTCMALLTPVAAASPIGDADNSITAAWKDAGGDSSDLGAKQGDCYVAGQGFAQDFVHGKMFFTPATGPRSMMGAILDKYEALGGPAASDLGFPTANEVRGLAGPDSRVSTFSASDKPLIYWTADHGAFVVRGAINAAWDKLGSSSGALGVPTGDETFDGELATQAFSGGKVSWNRLTKAFTTVPPDLASKLTDLQVPVDPTADINMAWRAAGGPSGPLGAKQGDQYPAGNDGLAQNFAGGKIFFSPASGANAIEADILTKYESLGGPGGDLGFPIANEADGGLKTASKISTFSAVDKPVIFWTADHGAFVVRGAIKAAWDKLLGATGKLGAPLGDQTVTKEVVTQKFSGGQIAWNKTKNTFRTEPANLASALAGLEVPGQKTPAGAASPGGKANWLTAHWWWLPAGIGALLLIGLVAFLPRWWRLRRAAQRDRQAHPGDSDESSYEPATESVARWSPDADVDLASSTLSEDHRPIRRTVRIPSQPSSEWMPSDHKSLVDELLEDETETPDELPGFADFGRDVHKERGRDVHEDFDQNVHEEHGHDVHEDFDRDVHEEFDEDPDNVDTDPTGIPLLDDGRGGRHAASDGHDDDAQVTEAVPIPRIAPGQLAIHLPMDDPYQVPDGYPVKAHASSGLYYMPDSVLYDETMSEIWFASEEIAQANGFHRAG
ncbi:LGFP repeat-containing protein [Mycobacterium sp.]|uniref:LGFP repeat-containing protein n=1 Tax=Mycobacterium sp. TaxID=1785 RepID=UPI003BAEEE95